jgi:tetratricopeptide (TPR) repeat protein
MITEGKRKVVDLFTQGRKLYKLMKFPEAQKCFGEALEIDQNDGPSKVYYLRCKFYIDDPPPEDWDGVFVMTHK